MGFTIQLSVLLGGQSEAMLQKVNLKHPWRDELKGMTFASRKSSMDMEDIAVQVEAHIEKLYERLHGDQQDELQVQVFKITDASGAKEFELGDDVSKHFKAGDTVVMELYPHFASQIQQAQRPQYSEEMIEQIRKMLRFDLNDRVLCWVGARWLSGHVVGTAVPDDDLLPYLVKTDLVPGSPGLPSRTISVPADRDSCCMQEVCFEPVSQLEMVRCATSSLLDPLKTKLRFAVGDEVACRLRSDAADGLENWLTGFVTEVWSKIGEASWDMGEAKGNFPKVVPYKVSLATGTTVSGSKWVYCHRDDHTLIRKKGMQPATRVKGTSKRMEVVQEACGAKFTVDHVTGRRKRMLEDDDDSD